MGFATSKSDSSLFIRQGRNEPIRILLYIDDLFIANVDQKEIGHVKSHLTTSFDMKDPRDLHYFLRIEVICTPEGILINQRHYVLSMFFKFGMMECKSVLSPLDRNVKLRPDKPGMMECKFVSTPLDRNVKPLDRNLERHAT